MKKYNILFLALSAIVLPVKADKTVKFDIQVSEARTMDVSPTTYVQPLVAEVKVDTSKGRIHDTWSLSLTDFQARAYPDNDAATLQNLRAYGLFKSSEKHNCDLIVAPTFDVRISDTGVEISLFGYPANFTNWKTGILADYDWILIEKGIQKVDEPTETQNKNNKKDSK